MSLYRKYRPQSFTHLVGQNHIKETLLNELKHEHAVHAYLLAGPRGTGKTSTARLLAKALNCTEEKNGEPCEKCEICLAIAEGSLIDVIEVDAASNRGIDEIRELRDKIKFAPTRAKNKVYIIDEVHMLTKEAFNALLKTLEEPPSNVYFILCTTEIHKIPETIVSRCQRFDFKRIDAKTIMTRLSFIAQQEGIEAEQEAIELIAGNAQGGMRDAISLFEQMVIEEKLEAKHVKEHLGIAGSESVQKFIDLLFAKEAAKALNTIQALYGEGYDLSFFHREVLEEARLRMLEAVRKNDRIAVASLLSMIDVLLETRDIIRHAPVPQLPLEIAAIRLCGGQISDIPEEADLETDSAKKNQKSKMAEAIKKELKKMTAEKTEERSSPIKIETNEEATNSERETAQKMKAAFDNRTWDIETVQDFWPQILESLTPPSIRRSVATAEVSDVSETTVTLTFASKFHMEKLQLVEHRAKLEVGFQKVFNRVPKIVLKFEELGLEPIVETQQEKGSIKEKSESIKRASTDDLAKKALEIFGEEEF